MKLLLLDNYDSFTYNLLHLMEQMDGVETDVIRNDKIKVEDVEKYDRIIISPGPGIPSEAGITIPLIEKYFNTKPMMGVCLGMQAMAEAGGGKIRNMPSVLHGISTITKIIDKNEMLFDGFPAEFKTGHYHSWCVDEKSLPASFKITSINEEGIIMSITHNNNMLRGVQFHPESVLTDFGKQLISNWLFRC